MKKRTGQVHSMVLCFKRLIVVRTVFGKCGALREQECILLALRWIKSKLSARLDISLTNKSLTAVFDDAILYK